MTELSYGKVIEFILRRDKLDNFCIIESRG